MRRQLAILATLPTLGACGDREAAVRDTPAVAAAPAAPVDSVVATQVGETTGLDVPESVRYDPDLDVYFVSNIAGSPAAKDNNGYIARIHPDSLGTVTRLVEGGRNGVTLHAPKGLAIQGDTIWVTDIDVVRGFDRRTGRPIGMFEFAGQNPTFLNDITVGIDGIYVTDSNVRFEADGSMTRPGTDRIFRLTERLVRPVATGDVLGSPNGIAWDAAQARFLVVSFATGGIMSWRPGDESPARVTAGPGQFDGVEVLDDGRVLVSSWADSAVHVLRGGTLERLIGGLPTPADIGVDTKRNLLLVPHFAQGRVSYWRF